MNIFRILGNALVFFLSSKQRQIIRKQKQIRKQKRGRAYLALTWQPSQPTGRPGTMLARASHLLPLARQAERSAPARARAPRHQAVCLRRLATATPRVFSSAPPRSPPLAPSHALPCSSPPLALSLAPPERVRRCRSPPPRPPPPPRLAEALRSPASSPSSSSPRWKAPEALDAASSAVPFLGPPRSLPPFRHLQASSEHADHPNVSAVSSRTEFPSSPPRFLAVAVAPLKTEPRRRTSSSPATFW